MSKLTDRIFKSWKTTILGALVIVTPLIALFVYPEQITFGQISAFYGVSIALFFGLSND